VILALVLGEFVHLEVLVDGEAQDAVEPTLY
jgi:hypothetical protein